MCPSLAVAGSTSDFKRCRKLNLDVGEDDQHWIPSPMMTVTDKHICGGDFLL